MNLTVRHLAALAGYGRGQGYLELRWRADRGMRSEHFAISDLNSAGLRALTLAPQHDVYVGVAPRARRPPVARRSLSRRAAAARTPTGRWPDRSDPTSSSAPTAVSLRRCRAIGAPSTLPASCAPSAR